MPLTLEFAPGKLLLLCIVQGFSDIHHCTKCLFTVCPCVCVQVFTNRYEFVAREQEAAVLQELTLQVCGSDQDSTNK